MRNYSNRFVFACILAMALVFNPGEVGHAATPMVSARLGYVLGLTSDGTVSAWGRNEYGQLGNGQAPIRVSPARVAGIAQVRAVAAGSGYTLALKTDGTVWGWGGNEDGELGDGTIQNKPYPVRVTGITGTVASIVAGDLHALALTTDGNVWAWGRGSSGQLGTGDTATRTSAVQIPGLTSTRALAAGSYHSLALLNDGSVWAWGDNTYGQLGNGTTTTSLIPIRIAALSNIVAISAAGNISLALDASGRVWAWGNGAWGSLGDGTYNNHSTPFVVPGLPRISAIKSGNSISIAVAADGTVWVWGSNETGKFGDSRYSSQLSPAMVSALTGFTGFAIGDKHVIAFDTMGAVRAWGQNDQGQLGVGDTSDRATPTVITGLPPIAKLAAGLSHCVAVATDGSVWTWGSNGFGELGDSSAAGSSVPGTVLGPGNMIAVAGGSFHSLSLRADGSVWGWGDNGNGQLGNRTRRNALVPIQVTGLPTSVAISAGRDYSLVLANNGMVWSWGDESSGRLGNGALTGIRPEPQALTSISGVTAISAGVGHGLALEMDGSVWSWGSNSNGQLGDGTTVDRGTPQRVNGLPYIIAVSAGDYHSMALDSGGKVWTWGYNWFGQLGDGTDTDRPTPVKISGLGNVVAISAGSGDSCAITQDGRMWTWGDNQFGQLGTGTPDDWMPVAGLVLGISGVRNISCYEQLSVAMRIDGTVVAWGRNLDGEVGDGTYAQRPEPVSVVNSTLNGVLDLAPEVPNTPTAKSLPFISEATLYGAIGSTTTITNTTKFNSGDVGKTGAVYVTALVPASASLRLTRGSAGGAGEGILTERSTTPSAPPVLMQLTPSGWQQVSNGQLIPYANGVLGDQLAAQTILNNTDTSTLAGAQFCLGYGTSADEMTTSGRMKTVVTIPDDPNNPTTTAAGCIITTPKDVRTYVPAATASGGYVSYVRVINTGSTNTPVTVARIDPATGSMGTAGTLTPSLPAGGAQTFSAQQVETALGSSLPAAERPRIRVSATDGTTIETQSYLLQPGGVFNEVSAAQSGSAITVPTYLPAAGAPSGYQSYLRVINTGSVASPVTIARVDPASGVAGSAATLVSSLPAGAALTYPASQVEGVLGLNLLASERPTLILTGTGTTLDAQSFLTQPGGAFTNVSSSQSGSTVDVRSYIPAATSGYTTYLRVINNGSTAVPVTASVLDGTTGATGASGTIIASLAAHAALTLTSSQIETALGVGLPAANRPRLRVSASGNNLTVQSFMLQPGGAFNEFSGAQTGTSVAMRTYIPAADAVSGYSSYIRIINTGATATPVSVALVDTSGTTGTPVTLIASLPPGGAQSFTPSQVEAVLGAPIAAGSRPRILISGNGTNTLEVQSFLTQPGGVFTEVSGGQ